MRMTILTILAFLLAACSQQQAIDRFSSDAEQLEVIEIAELLRDGDASSLAEFAHPEFVPQLPELVPQVSEYLDGVSGEFAVETVTVHVATGLPTQKQFVLLAGQDGRFAVVQITMGEIEGGRKLLAFYAQLADQNPKSIHEFHLADGGLLGFFWIGSMILSATICVIAAILVWRGSTFRFRPLWSLLSLIAVGRIDLNWTTNEWGLTPIAVQLLGASFMKAGPFSPWVLSFSLPLPAIGIILMYCWHRKLAMQNEVISDA